jgi:cytochrome bd-type quinol oxidase subunit 2
MSHQPKPAAVKTTVAHQARSRGLGRVLILVYGLLALAATGRSIYQLFSEFDRAPLAYSLSALAAVIYILATVALVATGRAWYRVAIATISFELCGVIIIGTLSLIDPVLFPEKTVWSIYGRGYAFVPLVLPIAGLIWLRATRPTANAVVA